MLNISPLKNPVQEYAWGSETAIQALLGETEAAGKPMAELWMGAHPKAPSKVLVDGNWESLDEVIDLNPESILGRRVVQAFSSKLPFLFKVLAAASPLSIQVHPSLEQASEGYARENALGIPLDSPDRNYKDDNHKPEILCALSPFQGLMGFRKIEEILGLMNEVSSSTLSHELELLRGSPDSHGLKRFFTSLVTMDKTRQRLIVSEAAGIAEKRSPQEPIFHWMSKLNRAYPGDVGVFSPIILNLVELEPGEALYIPAGELHAYLDGVGIELMANSDNVLRGGLTPKHVDVPELLKIVSFKSRPVGKIEPLRKGTCESIYPAQSREFMLSVISLNKGSSFASPRTRSVEILICTEGEAEIEDLGNGELLPLSRGRSVIVPAGVSRYRIDGNAIVYKASVLFPLQSSV
ncbi:MAG: mannose-6-phosphate isomerase, class I [Deltaproteobacteria bacterium]|nr:mannose-6-phosphate isomerase, class I [Deltaproteobacteria bacterium]MBW2167979.1 mannose-6-phosphate isomerase, class I [Deltaproteobacteria bacterium]